MEKIKNAIKNDLWIIVLDIFAINFAYFLALELRKRMSVGFEYGSAFSVFSGILFRYAPIYTVLCIIVFYLFRLYGGLWRYAGINDINRVVKANAVTCVMYIVGSLFYVKSTTYNHMPLTYYALGAFFQFFFICMIRFSYRVFVVEKRRVGKKQATALVVGAGELGRHTVQVLQSGVYFNVGCVVDTEDEHVGRLLDGIPVYDKGQIEELLDKFGVNCVFLAEPDLEEQDRNTIKKICENHSIEFRDYSNFFRINVEMESNVADVSTGERKIPFSPPDIGEREIAEVVEALRSGWITTGPRTKLLERRLAAYIETGRTDVDTEQDLDRWKDIVVCLNSATAAEELNLRILGIGAGDEVIVPSYSYTASASAAIHCGATVKFVDIQKDGDPVTHMPEIGYEALEAAITERTKAIVPVDLGGIVCDYDRIFEIV